MWRFREPIAKGAVLDAAINRSLFRSVARSFDGNAVGIVLTGNLSDGTVGLYEIKRYEGIWVARNRGEDRI
jgi:chemotaxis response regulator CheB